MNNTPCLHRRRLLGALALLASTAATGLAAPGHRPASAASGSAGGDRLLDWDDGMRIRLSPDAVFRLDEGPGERRLHLFFGAGEIATRAPAGLHGALQPQLVVVTPGGELIPLGGRCTVTCGANGATFMVNSGALQARRYGDDQAAMVVRAGDGEVVS